MRLTISRLAAASACLALGACARHVAHAPLLAPRPTPMPPTWRGAGITTRAICPPRSGL
jgi:hypothetical protein